MSSLDTTLEIIGDIAHESYTGCTQDEYSYSKEVIYILQDPRVKQQIKDLILITYQNCRDKTRNEHELDDLFNAAVNEL